MYTRQTDHIPGPDPFDNPNTHNHRLEPHLLSHSLHDVAGESEIAK